ncbi:MAG TPA: XisH family protein [Isosphaeraceae bacterium]|nr:XisH family protein [Isosphaeraceae bacterium]
MPARDRYHDQVKNALVNDGWTITDDPLHVRWGKKDMYVDLGAEQLLGAEKDQRKIAVEVKSFLGHSEMADLERAIGQYTIYHDVLSRAEPDRDLFLALNEEVYNSIFEEPLGELLLENRRIRLIIFDPHTETIRLWIPENPIAT